jgi:hypothetical protein
MARLTDIYYIKYSDEEMDGHKVPMLYKPNGLLQTDHQFAVEPSGGAVFVFTVPSDGPEAALRFNRADDPEGTPRRPVSWIEGADPEWIVLYDPVEPPYKTLALVVEGSDYIPAGRQASFNLNVYNPEESMFFSLRIRDDVGMQVDPTIIEKPPEV